MREGGGNAIKGVHERKTRFYHSPAEKKEGEGYSKRAVGKEVDSRAPEKKHKGRA